MRYKTGEKQLWTCGAKIGNVVIHCTQMKKMTGVV
jgi:hypothetical protein